ncbi:hypothetical protein ACQ4PT_005360 [Festuca glaucescens]
MKTILMELCAAPLLSVALVSLAILVSVLFGRRSTPDSKKKRRPPGPRRLPLIGNLLHLLTSEPPVALRDLARKHGPVMYLRLGQVDTVVISSPAAAQEVLRDTNLDFASRPSFVATEIICYGNLDVAFAPYGAYWRTLRKICTVELLSARKVRQFAAIRDDETLALVRAVQHAGGDGKPVDLGRLLMSCTNTITAKATFGEACDADLQGQFLSAIAVVLQLSSGLCVGDLFPSLRFVDVITGLRRRLWRARRQLDAVFDEIIGRCEARREGKKKPAADDLLSVMLRIKDEGELEFPIGTTNIKAVVVDLFTAGTDTTSSTAEWIMSELIRNPEAMAKAQMEIRQALDHKSTQDHEGCMDMLPYTRMVIMEALRLHPPSPLLLPRVCRETCDVGGFEVASGSRVMVNAWAIARSPMHWGEDAEEFRPERFEDGAARDYNGTQYEYLPFGSGRRMCPGGNFGLATLELITVRLLYYFDWSLPSGVGPNELDMEMVVTGTARRRSSLHLAPSQYKMPVMEIQPCSLE